MCFMPGDKVEAFLKYKLKKKKTLLFVLIDSEVSNSNSSQNLAKEVEKITKFKALPHTQNEKPTPTVNIDDDFDEDDTDDLEKIKGEIMHVLSKLDQAEVE